MSKKNYIAFGAMAGFALFLILAASAPPKYVTESQLCWTNSGGTATLKASAPSGTYIPSPDTKSFIIEQAQDGFVAYTARSGGDDGTNSIEIDNSATRMALFGVQYPTLTKLFQLEPTLFFTPYFFDTSFYNDAQTIFAVRNFHTNICTVDFAGNGTNNGHWDSAKGFASYSTLATNAVGGSGYTNNQTINQVVYLNGTAVAVTQKNRAGTTIVPATTFTGTMTVVLQPGWPVTAASGLTGTAVPF